MKPLNVFLKITNNFLVNKRLKNRQKMYEYRPEDKDKLINIIVKLLSAGQTDLNCIDVSNITDMSELFYRVNEKVNVFNIDISDWNVSNVKDMHNMFLDCFEMTCDIPDWKVSRVKDMSGMFKNCYNFNSDISKWNMSKVKNVQDMFNSCRHLNCDFTHWNIDKRIIFDYIVKRTVFYDCRELIKNKLAPSWFMITCKK